MNTLALLAWMLAAVPAPPGVVIDHEPHVAAQYIGSPSIVILPDGGYLASHDLFGKDSTQSTSALTKVFLSRDRGKTWRQTAEMHDQFWSNLFVHKGSVYLMGTTYEYGRIVIRKSRDGMTWSAPSMLTEEAGYHTAPLPVVIQHGRLWRAMEYHPQGPWGHFEAFLISAPVGADLMNPKSWTMTPRLQFPAQAGVGKDWLEGNAVIAPDGSLLDVLRVNDVEKAAIAKLKDGELHFEAFTDFPGGAKKFTIRYDRKSKRYWALANPALKEFSRSAEDPASVRNTLALLSSKDLKDWRVERIVVSHPDPVRHAFQYPDWQFDGKDIVCVSRTAFDDEAGGAPRGHDANFLTFHRIANFREPERH